MKIKLLIITLFVFLSSCGNEISQHNEIITTDKTGHVCDSKTGICDEVSESDFFQNATLDKKDSVLNKNYPAPDIVGLENWINSKGFSSLDELRWQVVLIDFWTLGCINCIRTLPHLVETYEIYNDQWFEIIAAHAPEFAYEQKIEAVQRAVDEYNLSYPIAQDNNFLTWKAYKNRYWPAHYLIDKQWNVRYTHFGQWKYQEMRQAIEELLAE